MRTIATADVYGGPNGEITKIVPNRKPPRAGMGRPKGSPNKMTAKLKDMILNALNDAGGEAYLVAQSEKNPAAFMTLVGKVLPLQVDAEHSGEVGFRLIERRLVKAGD